MFLIEQILNDSQDLRSSVVQVKEWAEVVRSNLLGVSQFNCDYAKSSVVYRSTLDLRISVQSKPVLCLSNYPRLYLA